MTKLNPRQRAAKEKAERSLRRKCDRLAVQIVSRIDAYNPHKLAATVDAERGYTEREMEAKYGWTGGFMASLYTKSANRKRMVIEAARRSMVLPDIHGVLPEKSPSNSKALQDKKGPLVRSRKVP